MPSQELSVELRLRFGKRDYVGDSDDYAEVNTEADDDDDLAKRQLWKRFSRLQRSNDFLRDGGIQHNVNHRTVQAT